MERKGSTVLIIGLFRLIPRSLRQAFFRGLLAAYYRLAPRRRLITLHNLRRAFPEKSMDEIVRLAREVYRHLAMVIADFFEMTTIDEKSVHAWIDLEGLENMVEAWSLGRGAIGSIGHFGNWEYLTVAFPYLEALARRHAPGRALPVFPRTASVVYRPLDNPIVENLITWSRTYHGVTMIPKGGTLRLSEAALKNGQIVAIVGDQNVSPREGVFTTFFGRPACTATGIATLAMRTGAPVLPVYLYRRPDGRYRFGCKPMIPMADTGNTQADLHENTQRCTTALEYIIREHPEQYFWMHQRWKTKPWQKE